MQEIGILGAGLIGASWASFFAAQGLNVRIYDVNEEVKQQALGVAENNLQRLVKLELLSEEAMQTSAIEGEILDRLSVQSSLRRHLGLDPDSYPAKPREQGVAQLVEPDRNDPRDIVGDDQRDRAGQRQRQPFRRRIRAVEGVGRPFVEIGDHHENDLGEHEIERRPDDAHLQVRPVARPHVGPEIPQR